MGTIPHINMGVTRSRQVQDPNDADSRQTALLYH